MKACLAALAVILLGGPLISSAEERPVVAVGALRNESGRPSFDPLCETIANSVYLTLLLMNRFDIAREDDRYSAEDLPGLKSHADQHGVDNIVFGKLFVREDGTIVIAMSVYDRLSDSVAVAESASAQSIFDTFDAVDQIVVALVEGFSGVHVTFGALRLEPRGETASCLILIDGHMVGEGVTEIDKVPAGRHDIRIVQERLSGDYELFSGEREIGEDETVSIAFTVPYLTGEESRLLGGFDRTIAEGWGDGSRREAVLEAFEQVLKLAQQPFLADQRPEVSRKYEVWRQRFSEYLGQSSQSATLEDAVSAPLDDKMQLETLWGRPRFFLSVDEFGELARRHQGYVNTRSGEGKAGPDFRFYYELTRAE